MVKVLTVLQFYKTLVCILSFILIVGFSLIYNNSVHRIENIETQLKMVKVIRISF